MSLPLDLFEAETNCHYRLFVNEEDLNRAQNDVRFAQSLLFHAKVNQLTVNEEENEGADRSSVTKNENNNPTTSTDHDYTYNADNQNLEDNLECSSNVDAFDLNGPSLESEDSESTKHIWGFYETICLINSMESHMDDLAHATKRKHVWQNVANDLSSAGYSVTNVICHNNWRNLLRCYKSAKDNKTKTGTTKSRFLFFDKIDNLLGEKPSNSSKHSLESSNLEDIEEPDWNDGENDTTKPTLTSPNPNSNSRSESSTETPIRKRKRGNDTMTFLRLKEERRHERFLQKMELQKQKLQLDEKKIALLEKLIESNK